MISDYLSNEERFVCIKTAALAYAAEQDIEKGPLSKKAGVLDGILSTGTAVAKGGVQTAKGGLLLAALGAGVPLGVFSHIIGRRIKGKRVKEEELKEKIKAYTDATNSLAYELEAGGM